MQKWDIMLIMKTINHLHPYINCQQAIINSNKMTSVRGCCKVNHTAGVSDDIDKLTAPNKCYQTRKMLYIENRSLSAYMALRKSSSDTV